MLLNCGVGENSWESNELQRDPMNCKEIEPVRPKVNQSQIFTEGLMLRLQLPILWPPDAKNWLTGKDPDAGKDWRWVEKGTREDEVIGWHHWLNGHEFEHPSGAGDGQGSLAFCVHGVSESDTTERLDWTEPESMKAGFNIHWKISYTENLYALVAKTKAKLH